MSSLQLLENKNAVMLLANADEHLFYFADLRSLKEKHWGPSEARPLLTVRYYQSEKPLLESHADADMILTLAAQDGKTRIERLLHTYNHVIDRRTLTGAIDAESAAAHQQYELPSGRSLLFNLAHGVYSNQNFYWESGPSAISFGDVLCDSGPQYATHNPFTQFKHLMEFYDLSLDQQTKPVVQGVDRSRYERFFNAQAMHEAEAFFGPSDEFWKNLRRSLQQAGIVSLQDIQARVHEFEENFYPGEFKKAVDGIKETRAWLHQLRSR